MFIEKYQFKLNTIKGLEINTSIIVRHKKLAILLTLPSLGGLELNLLKLYKYLLDHQNLSVVMIIASEGASESWLKKEQLPYILISKPRKYFAIKQFLELSQIMKKHKIQELILSSSQDLDLACWAKLSRPQFKNLKIIFYQQMQLGVPKKNIYQRWKLHLIHTWISPLPWLKKELLHKTTISSHKVIILPLCFDTHEFLEQLERVDKNNFRQRYSINKDTFIFGIIGRIDPGKGQLAVVKSFAKLLKNTDYPGTIKLCIVGSATLNDETAKKYELELEKTINALELGANIIKIPHVHQPAEIYAILQCLIVASQKETFGMVTIEGLLANLVVIGANSGGTPELLEHGDIGLLYDPNDDDSLLLAMKDALANYSEHLKKVHPSEISHLYDFKRLENFLVTLV